MKRKYPRCAFIKECDKKGLTLDERLAAWREHKRLIKLHRKEQHPRGYTLFHRYPFAIARLMVQLRYLNDKIRENKRELR